jgi:hypothetical protein
MNRKYFSKKYPDLKIHFCSDNDIADNTYIMVE